MRSAIRIRIAGVTSFMLQDLWKELRAAGLAEDQGDSLHDAIKRHVLNLELRWQDILQENLKRLCERCEERPGTHAVNGRDVTPTDRGDEVREVSLWVCNQCDRRKS